MTRTSTKTAFRLGPWLVEPTLKTVSRGAERRRLTHKAMAVLVCLAEQPGRVVTREELVAGVWEGSFTSDEAVTAVVYEVRKTLDDSARAPRYVETIHKGGYRLIAPVAPVAAAAKAPVWRRAAFAAPLAAAALLALTLVTVSPDDAPAVTPEAEEALELGTYFLRQATPESTAKAHRYLRRAVELEPSYAPAHAALADAWLADADHLPAAAQPEAYRQAKAAARTALGLDRELGTAHVALACVYFQHEWNWPAAARHFELGFEPNTCSVEDGRRYAWYLSAVGRHDEAVAAMEQAVVLDPAAKTGRLALAWTYYLARRWDDALAELELAAELDPEYLEVRQLQGDVFLALGRHDEALRACQRALELLGDDPGEVTELADAFAAAGMDGVLRRLIARDAGRGDGVADPVRLARLEARRDDAEAALAWLERAFVERHDDLVWVRVDPAFDGLRGHGRFQKLLERLGLPA